MGQNDSNQSLGLTNPPGSRQAVFLLFPAPAITLTGHEQVRETA
jgi:hypothetical protein